VVVVSHLELARSRTRRTVVSNQLLLLGARTHTRAVQAPCSPPSRLLWRPPSNNLRN
jgi:hypothetical protein